ncbi:diguanylate cyclase [Oceanimonas baumannii]|uniref:diguanylate cyclase domain-containing protein n=1 Tax=Oceanimonas baumannii TaxID=129578 RepID=UPI001D17EF03|nr:diguanylate cyclase [Oceanimonas baumannii]MCC4264232.1 diguanylate cyclase [Oceanimonas baumannii]
MLNSLLNLLPERHDALRILIVDDQPLNIRVLHEVFRNQVDVLMTTDPTQVLTLCHEQRPDLVLLDVIMPQLSGYEVCRQLKSDEATREIPVIFVTAKDNPEDEAMGFEAGAVDFISKPINPVTVMARVKTHLTLKLQSDALRAIAMVDGLTGVGNRRRFDEQFLIAWRRCMRNGQPLSLMLIDLDHFKQYNDLYGHPAGDDCLRQVARMLNQSVRRPDDLLARYGGEEFVCLLPDTPHAGAMGRAQVMLDAIDTLNITHTASSVANHVTVSIGVATVTPHIETEPAALLSLTDERLYAAKNQGRHQACGQEDTECL